MIARRTSVQLAEQSWETLQAARASIASFAAGGAGSPDRAGGHAAGGAGRLAHGARRADRRTAAVHGAIELVGAQHDAALAEYTLVAAIGRLIAPVLKLPVELYDMEHHYKLVKDKWFGFAGGIKE